MHDPTLAHVRPCHPIAGQMGALAQSRPDGSRTDAMPPRGGVWFKALGGLLLAWVIGSGLVGCGGGGGGGSTDEDAAAPPPVGLPGVLAIAASPRLDPYPQTRLETAARFNQAATLAFNAGARGLMTTFPWRSLEPAAGAYDADKLDELRAALDSGAAGSMTRFVGIEVISTNLKEFPADLAQLPMDDPLVMSRFRALLDAVIGVRTGRVQYLSIGNEVDVYLTQHPAELAAYKAFFRDASQYARSLDPAIQVGLTARADGALGGAAAMLQDLNALADVVMMTYYPLELGVGGAVTVRDPSVVAGDFARLLAFAGAKPLVFQEVGYPASTTNKSSQALQARFVHAVFSAWSAANGQIPFLSFFQLHDFTPQLCDVLLVRYAMPGAASFRAFLCSLGLREVNGTPRLAWNALVEESRRLTTP